MGIVFPYKHKFQKNFAIKNFRIVVACRKRGKLIISKVIDILLQYLELESLLADFSQFRFVIAMGTNSLHNTFNLSSISY